MLPREYMPWLWCKGNVGGEAGNGSGAERGKQVEQRKTNAEGMGK